MCLLLCNTFAHWLKEKKANFLFYIYFKKFLCCRSCPAAACSGHPLCSSTVHTWCLPKHSWKSVRERCVTVTRGTAKTVTAPSCWSTPALATHTGCFCTDGWRRASAVRSAWGESTHEFMQLKGLSMFCVSLRVSQSPSVQLGWSTVSAPSPALQPAIASTSRRSARRSVWTAARVLVPARLPLSLFLCSFLP